MTPFPSPQEIARMQAECKRALADSEKAEGLEKLRLINKAFPYAVQGTGYGLKITWVGDGFSISDIGGFITKIDRDDSVTMLVMIGMESAKPGSVRELITGKKRKEIDTKSMAQPQGWPKKKSRPKGTKISLADIGLKKET